jgi:hypothetical protein
LLSCREPSQNRKQLAQRIANGKSYRYAENLGLGNGAAPKMDGV